MSIIIVGVDGVIFDYAIYATDLAAKCLKSYLNIHGKTLNLVLRNMIFKFKVNI